MNQENSINGSNVVTLHATASIVLDEADQDAFLIRAADRIRDLKSGLELAEAAKTAWEAELAYWRK